MFVSKKMVSVLVLALMCVGYGFSDGTLRNKIASRSQTYLGTPYAYGGDSRSGMDCSGFVCTVFAEAAGMNLPRSSGGIHSHATPINYAELQVGDLLFFSIAGNGRVGHVGIYLGDNKFIHAASAGPNRGVIISDLYKGDDYWLENYLGAGRVLAPASVQVPAPVVASAPKDNSYSSGSQNNYSSGSRNNYNSESQNSNYQQSSNWYQEEESQDSYHYRTEESWESVPEESEKKKTKKSSKPGLARKIFSNFSFDINATFDWTFYTPEKFAFIPRGFTLGTTFMYNGLLIDPGIGVSFVYDHKMNVFQMPLYGSIQLSKYLRIYGGVMFSFGQSFNEAVFIAAPTLGSSDVWLPSILGITIKLPEFNVGKVKLSLIQDVQYKGYAHETRRDLSALRAFTDGLVFSTGFRVTFPLGNFL